MQDPVPPPQHLAPPRSSRSPLRRLADHARTSRFGWTLWALFVAGITAAVLITPTRHRTNNAYRTAALHYLHSEPVYTPGPQGFIYPVQSALVYLPFALPEPELGDILWRDASILALAAATWRLSRRIAVAPADISRSPFSFLSVLIIPIAIGSARNGQMNLMLSALLVNALADVIAARWNAVALTLCLALACKPIAIVPLLLTTALYPPLWRRIPLGLLAVAALPFLHPDWHYVVSQYSAGLAKVIEAGEPGVGRFSDLTSLITSLGAAEPGETAMTALRAGAAAFTLLCCAILVRRTSRPAGAGLAAAMGISYLMIFNPRTEGNTYVLLAPFLAVLAAWSWSQRRPSARTVALVGACILLGCAHLIVPGRHDDHIIRPAIAALAWLWLGAAALVPALRNSLPLPAVQPNPLPVSGSNAGSSSPSPRIISDASA